MCGRLRIALIALGCSAVDGARVHALVEEESELDSMVVHESVALASGFMNVSNDQPARDMSHKRASGKCPWPDRMTRRYSDERVVGSGATACVYLAKEKKTGTTVAIKVAKRAGKLQGWKKECDDMQRLRRRACSMGKEIMGLAETYLPTCIEVGEDGGQAFYVMHAAGIVQVKQYTGHNALRSKSRKKDLFLKLWASVYALHAVGYTHNDLHGGNIVVDDKDNIALIDFGEIVGHHAGKGYKHDINSVWQWSSVLLGCTNSEWGLLPASQLRVRKENYLRCLKSEIGVDDGFQKAMDGALEAAMKSDSNQHLKEIYESDWFKANNPKFQRLFIWADLDGCLAWDWKKIIDQKVCTELPGFFKCPQESRPGACFRASGSWDCWRAGSDFWADECKDKGFEGACTYPNFGKEITEESQVESCDTVAAQCTSQCKATDWGACYMDDAGDVSEHLQCFCVPGSNKFLITRSMLKNGCETKQVPGYQKAYSGLCKLQNFAIPKAGQSLPTQTKATTASGPAMTVAKGQKCKCKNRSGILKPCTVVSVTAARAKMRFDGFSARFDKYYVLTATDQLEC